MKRNIGFFCLVQAFLFLQFVPVRGLAGTDNLAEISAEGSVQVNGETVQNTQTITSGSVITTGDKATATITYPNRFKLVLYSGSKFMVDFDNTTVTGYLGSGALRVQSEENIGVAINTSNAKVNLPDSLRHHFLVEMPCRDEDFDYVENQDTPIDEIGCTTTYVESFTGKVDVHNKAKNTSEMAVADTDEQIKEVVNSCSEVCAPEFVNIALTPTNGLGNVFYVALVAGAGSALVAAFLPGSSDENSITKPGTIVSPIF